MGGRLTLAISIALLISSSPGCSNDSGVEDSFPDAAFPCAFPTDAGSPFDLRLGVLDPDAEFQELADGDSVPVLTGTQGGQMTILELRAALPVSMDGICLACDYEVTGDNGFETATGTTFSKFSEVGPEQLRSSITIIVAPGSAMVDGVEVNYALTCEGHGAAATARRTLVLDAGS